MGNTRSFFLVIFILFFENALEATRRRNNSYRLKHIDINPYTNMFFMDKFPLDTYQRKVKKKYGITIPQNELEKTANFQKFKLVNIYSGASLSLGCNFCMICIGCFLCSRCCC